MYDMQPVMGLNGIHYRVLPLHGLIQKWLLNQQDVSIMLLIQNRYSNSTVPAKVCLWLACIDQGCMYNKGYSLLYDSI